MPQMRRIRLELPTSARLAPWALARPRVLELPSRRVEIEACGERRLVEVRTLAAHHEALLVSLGGGPGKGALPLAALVTIARLSPRRLVHTSSGTVYRHVRADRNFVVAVAVEQMAGESSLSLRRALDLASAEAERPAPQTA